MSKNFKKILSLLIVAVLALTCFAACGKKEDGGTTDGGTLVIGGIGPLTGGAAVYGTNVKNGAQIAIDEINAAGGVNGIKLSLNFQDDEHDPEKAVNAYNTLKDAGMKILMGTVTSKPCIAVAAESVKDNIFQITPSGSAVECAAPANVFRICFNDPNQGFESAKVIAAKKLATKIAVIYDSSDVYSSGIFDNFKTEAATQGLEIVTEQAFTEDNKTDFSVQLQKVKESGADMVFLPIYYQEAALVLQQADKAGVTATFFGCDGLDGIISQLDNKASLAEGVMLLTPFSAYSEEAKSVAFTKSYREKFDNATPNQFAADAYDAIYTIKAALEKADVKDANISASELCELLKKAMTEITVEGVTGTMTWTANGEPTKTPKAMIIKDSVYKDIA